MPLRVKAVLLGAVLTIIAPGLATAAPPSSGGPVADPEGAIVSELVVQAKEPGPAWWKVSDKDTTVYILGLPDGGSGAIWSQHIKASNPFLSVYLACDHAPYEQVL
ncbi:MAG: hypothetical protein ACXU8S_11130, partial [Phenylobacterium sp.]